MPTKAGTVGPARRHGRSLRSRGPATGRAMIRIATSNATEPTSSMASMNSTGAARTVRETFAQDHHRAAQAHQFPGKQKEAAVPNAEHAERAQQAACRTEQPTARPDWAGVPRRQARSREPGRTPSATGRPASSGSRLRVGHAQRDGGRRGPVGQTANGGDDACQAAEREQDPRPAQASARSAQECRRQSTAAQRRPADHSTMRPPFTRCGARSRNINNASMMAAGLGGQPGR